jgi:hypothetical protein
LVERNIVIGVHYFLIGKKFVVELYGFVKKNKNRVEPKTVFNSSMNKISNVCFESHAWVRVCTIRLQFHGCCIPFRWWKSYSGKCAATFFREPKSIWHSYNQLVYSIFILDEILMILLKNDRQRVLLQHTNSIIL